MVSDSCGAIGPSPPPPCSRWRYASAINAAIFAVVNSVLLKPLPVAHPDRLAVLYNTYPRAGVERASNGVPDYYDRLDEVSAFEELALYNTRGVTIGDRLAIRSASAAWWRGPRCCGCSARHRSAAASSPRPKARSVQDHKVILSYGLWQQLYGGRDDAVGQNLRVGGEPHDDRRRAAGRLLLLRSRRSSCGGRWRSRAEERSDEQRHSNNWSMVGAAASRARRSRRRSSRSTRSTRGTSNASRSMPPDARSTPASTPWSRRCRTT